MGMAKLNFLFIIVVIFLFLVNQGMGQCSLKDMSLNQTKVDKNVHHKKPYWNVTITNNCYCSQSNVKIGCMGKLSTKEEVDPSIKKIAKGKGLVNNGEPVYPYSSVGFTYASRLPLKFKLLSSQVACS
ncbi:Protein TAPETUM DETERMINANT 1 [Bienertia sinuspersici]